MNKLIVKMFATSSVGLFCSTFVWALLAGLFIQLVVLPAIPGLHAGHGLMVGGDWVGFHREGAELAALMQHQGWQVWELRPQGNAPIGIAAAVYFLAGVSEPWVLLPVNATMFALAAVSLHGIFNSLISERWTFMATLPFVLFPSAALLYSQIHKDVFSVAGILIIVLAWVRFAWWENSDGRSFLREIALTVTGGVLVWMVRPYLLQPLVLASVLTMLLLVIRFGRRRGVTWWTGLFLCLLVQVGYSNISSELSVSTVPIASDGFKNQTYSAAVNGASFIQINIAKLNAKRVGFATGAPQAGSNIDVDMQFDSLIDLVLYVPRALQVGVLAPFPPMWLSNGVSPGSGLMRFIAGVEMVVSYVLVVGVGLLWFSLKNNRPALMVAILMATVLILAMALVVCNVGTLYRMRYGGWQLLNGLGVLGWGVILRGRRGGQSP